MGRHAEEDGPTTKLVFLALAAIQGTGKERVGPIEIARWLLAERNFVIRTTTVSGHLRKLVAAGKAERLPLGRRKALYRLVEEF